VPGIVGLGAALELAHSALQSGEPERQAALRDSLVDGLLSAVPGAVLTGSRAARLPGHASFRFPGIEGEPLLLNLDMRGICGSSGAACATGEIEPSHVLLALGLTREEAHGALRLTLGRGTTAAEVDRVLAVLPPLVASLRGLATQPIESKKVPPNFGGTRRR
jgi:cysteine desulfurase